MHHAGLCKEGANMIAVTQKPHLQHGVIILRPGMEQPQEQDAKAGCRDVHGHVTQPAGCMPLSVHYQLCE